MRGFNPDPVMRKYLELDQITPIETLMELQDDRECAKCGRMFVRIEDQISKIDSFDEYIGKMKKRRDSRAQSLEKQMKQVTHEFFDIGHKPKKINTPKKKPRLFYMAKTAPQLRMGQLDLST